MRTASPAIASTIPPTATNAQTFTGATLSSSHRVRCRRTGGSVAGTGFGIAAARMKLVMAAIDPGLRRRGRFESFLRQGTRLAVVAAYLTAAVVALILVRPAFRAESTPVEPPRPAAPATDVIRKGETAATFAARHGLDLGELLALNPRVDSLELPAGTRLRVG